MPKNTKAKSVYTIIHENGASVRVPMNRAARRAAQSATKGEGYFPVVLRPYVKPEKREITSAIIEGQEQKDDKS